MPFVPDEPTSTGRFVPDEPKKKAAPEAKPAAKETPTSRRPWFGDVAEGVGEAALSTVGGIAAPPIGQLAGMSAMAARSMGLPASDPADIRNRVQSALTPSPPKTVTGQALMYPFEKMGQGVDWLAGKSEKAAMPPETATGLPAELQRAYARGGSELMRQLPALFGAKVGGAERPPIVPQTLDPRAIPRMDKATGLPVPITEQTRGQLTRDPVQLRRESMIAQTGAGKPLRDVYVDQNARLLQNLDTLRGRTGPKSETSVETGRRVAGDQQPGRPGAEGALTRQAAESKKEINRLYRKAEIAGELQGKVPTQDLMNHLIGHDDPTMVGYAINKLKALKILREDEFGNLVPQKPTGPHSGVLSLKELEGVRRAAVAAEADGGTKAVYARQLKRVIDDMTAGVGGNAYKAARKARLDYANRFDEPKAIDQLIANKTRTDRATALEDVWGKTVIDGSIADLKKVRDTLLDATDRRTRDSGRKAWRDIAGQTVQHIRDEATKSAALDEAGNMNLSAPELKNVLGKIGDEKLELLLGKTASKQLHNLAEVAADLKTKPPARIAGSDTGANLMVMMDRILDHVPILGPISKGAIRMGRKAYGEGTAGRDVTKALQPPMSGPPPSSGVDPMLKALPLFMMQNRTQE